MTFLDTSIIIDFLAGDKEIVVLVKELSQKEDVKTTTITEYELMRHKTKFRREAAEKFLSAVTVFSFDRASARKAALLYEKLRETGEMINENDLLIAGISLSNDEILLTRDRKFSNLGEASIKIL